MKNESIEISVAIEGGRLVAAKSTDHGCPGISVNYETSDGTQKETVLIGVKNGHIYILGTDDCGSDSDTPIQLPIPEHMESPTLDVDGLRRFAKEHYSEGGYAVINGWKGKAYREYSRGRRMSKESALQYFKDAVARDIVGSGPALSWEELKNLAKEFYLAGGHIVSDNWNKDSFNSYVAENGPITGPVAFLIFSGIPKKDWFGPFGGLPWNDVVELSVKFWDAGGYVISEFWSSKWFQDWVSCFGPMSYWKLFSLFYDFYHSHGIPREWDIENGAHNPILGRKEFLALARDNYKQGGWVFVDSNNDFMDGFWEKNGSMISYMEAIRVIAEMAGSVEKQAAFLREHACGKWGVC